MTVYYSHDLVSSLGMSKNSWNEKCGRMALNWSVREFGAKRQETIVEGFKEQYAAENEEKLLDILSFCVSHIVLLCVDIYK
jgi:hypothetical protein